MHHIILAAALSAVEAVAFVLVPGGPGGQTSAQVPRDPARQPAARTGAIHGRVFAADTGQPIRWAHVTAAMVGARPVATSTDADGRYRLDALAAGRYVVSASKRGFVPLTYGVRSTYGPPLDVVVVGPAERAEADFALARGAAVGGRITLADGEPAQNVSVQATRFVYGSSVPRTVMAGRPARTDDRGVFRLHSLPPGLYFILVSPLIAPGPAPDFPELVQRPHAFATTYFPGTARFNEAQRITVAAGETKQIELSLADVPLASVSFRVTDSAGRAPARAGVSLQYARGILVTSQGLSVARTESSFPRVPPGDYWLYVCVTTEESQPEFALTEFRVSGQDLTGLAIRTAPGTTVRGRIEADEGAPAITPTGMAVLAFNTTLPSLTGDPNGPSTPARAGPDGRFEFRSLFGPRVFRMPRLSSPWAVKAVLLDGRDVADTEVDFRASASPREIRLIVTNQTGAVSGTVARIAGRPASGAHVVIFSTEEERWGVQSRHIKVGTVATGGEFSVDGLLPGVYFAAAVNTIEDGAWNDPFVLRALSATAARVTVKALATASVRLEMGQR